MKTPPTESLFGAGRKVAWFSCGAASAVTAKMTVDKYGVDGCEVVYCDTSKSESDDNPRFMRDVEVWIGKKIQIIRHPLYSTVEEVFDAFQYMSGIKGARCSTELKIKVRKMWQRENDVHIFGFTADEQDRITDLEENNPGLYLEWVLRDNSITKKDCYRIIQQAGIKLPEKYLKGYRNNNCHGCVKSSSPGYWSKVRRDTPEVFQSRAEQSRRLGVRLVKLHGVRIFLDELPDEDFPYKGEDLSCGPQCKIETDTE